MGDWAAYVIIPIIGASRPDQIVENVKALDVALTPEYIADIEAILAYGLYVQQKKRTKTAGVLWGVGCLPFI